jgi:hypothetical protein
MFRFLPRFIKEGHIKRRRVVNTVFAVDNFIDSVEIALVLVVN